jgi:aminoglycoside phosphotransferase (APT) family kinase protein
MARPWVRVLQSRGLAGRDLTRTDRQGLERDTGEGEVERHAMLAPMIAGPLELVLGSHLHTSITLSAEPTRLSGGFWAAIHRFSIDAPAGGLPAGWSGPLVLRVMPDRARAEHEIIVQRTVAEQGFPTPKVLAHGFDEALGGAFMVMPLSAGTSPMSSLGAGTLFALPRLLRRLPDQLAEMAIRLHALDPAPVAAALADAGLDASDGVESRLTAIGFAGTTGGRGFDALLDWFRDHRPSQPDVVVCHGDLHPFNLLVDGDGHTTVLDWTNGDLLPREFDVGFTAAFLRCAPIRVPKFAARGLGRVTAWVADRFVTTYERSAPIDHQMVTWFEALQLARCLAEVATARSGLSHVVDDRHPFEVSADAMSRRLATLTGITIALPVRPDDRRH